MIKFMVDLSTSPDSAAVAAIEEIRNVVIALDADMQEITRNGGGHASSEEPAPAATAAKSAKPAAAKATKRKATPRKTTKAGA